MANPWENDPIVQPAGQSPAPWANDPLAQPDSLLGKIAGWTGTRATNALTGTMQFPSMLEGLGTWAVGQGAHAAGLPPPPPKEAPGPFDTVAATAQLLKRWIFNNRPQVNLPGKGGKVIDTAVEAAMSAPMLGGGVGTLIPAAVGGAGSEVAGQLTEGTPYEIPARLAGGVLGAGAGAGAQALGRYGWQAGKSFVEPFTKPGQEAIVGRTLNRVATDPKRAAAAAGASQPTIPGSRPTTAQAANDPGLLAAENVLKGQVGRSGEFSMRAAESNAARMAAADKVAPAVTAQKAGDTIRTAMQGRKDALEGLRKQISGPMYEAARIMDPAIPAKPIMDSINTAIMTETGPIRSALQQAKNSLYIGAGQNKRLASSPGEWQAVRRALDAQIKGVERGSPIERQLVMVRDQVDDALKQGSMFRLADETFRRMSEPLRPYTADYGPRVAKALEKGPFQGPYTRASELLPDDFLKRGATGADEMLAATGFANQGVKQAVAGRLMADFKDAIRTTADDPLGNKVLSAAAADRWWQANKDVAAKVMTKDQVRALQTLVDDFAMGARRPQGVAGSPTMQNLSSGNILNAVLRFPALADTSAAQSMMRPLQWLYRLPEEQIQQVLMDAMLDPKVASALMVKASAGNVKLLAPMLRQALTGSAGAQAVSDFPALPTTRGGP